MSAETYAGIGVGLARWRGPALILYGAVDAFGLGWVEVQRRQIADARTRVVVVVPNAGHLPWLEQPAPSLAAVRTLVSGS